MEQQLKRIQDKVQLLLKKQLSTQKENEKLQAENTELKAKLEENKNLVEALEQKLTALKAASGNLSDLERKDLEKRMSGYIREIDRCITMLAE